MAVVGGGYDPLSHCPEGVPDKSSSHRSLLDTRSRSSWRRDPKMKGARGRCAWHGVS
jgi:hypothetical protein